MNENSFFIGLCGFGMTIVIGIFGMIMSLIEYWWGKNDVHNRK